MAFKGIKTKTALVLAGGGLTGAVYEIGALRAIDDLLVDRTVNDFDVYVGTSAGSLVTSCLANGITTEQLMRIVDGSAQTIEPIGPKHLFRFDMKEFSRRALQWPRVMWGAWSHYLQHLDDMTVFDLLWSLSEGLPAALYDGLALEKYVRATFDRVGATNNFAELARKLFIIATDLDTGERRVFGEKDSCDVPISLAVAASTALPLVYKPVRVGEKEYVDGGLRGTASLDVAIEAGANLVICINPLVPFDNSERTAIPFLGKDGGYLSDKGMQAIASQVSRITIQAGLHYHIKQLRRAYPEVDIVLIEPRPDDHQMFFYNVMRYSARRTIAEHGFEAVTLGLAENHRFFRDILHRHNIPINRTLAQSELQEIRQSAYDQEVIKHVLERRTGEDIGVVDKLKRTLAELEIALEKRETESATG